MRRTYGSKKDMAGALDHRDMIQNVDEKSSIFSAFSIKNIKQTKRELSNLGGSSNYSVVNNKVRKRKYVRRIVKEAETIKEQTMSASTYLTPDKSFRVNKVLDPFDMLLMSSPQTRPVETKQDIQKSLVKKKERTYTKKKLKKPKKINYSSSDSFDSDKENSSANQTDIRTHNLVVERASINSPKTLDESINKIVRNLSLINNYKKTPNTSFNTSFKRNRLTKYLNSPILQKSPLCSTPFKEKYRGKSIYNFSPITSKDSPNFVSITEEDNNFNNSIVFSYPKKSVTKEFESSILDKNRISKDATIIAIDKNYDCEQIGATADVSPLISKDKTMNNATVIASDKNDAYHPDYPTSDDKSLIYEDQIVLEHSSLQTTEPFLGFPADIHKSIVEYEHVINNYEGINNIDTNDDEHEMINRFEEDNNKANSSEICQVGHHLGPDLEFANSFVDNNNVTVLGSSEDYDRTCDVEMDRSNCSGTSGTFKENGLETSNDDEVLYQINENCVNNSNYSEIYEKTNSFDDNEQSHNLDSQGGSKDSDIEQSDKSSIKNSPNSSIGNKSDSQTSVSYYSDKESNYDTCNSEQSFEDYPIKAREPIVAIERMSSSLFMKYYEKKLNDNNTDEEIDSISHRSDCDESCDVNHIEPEIIENKYIEIVITDSSTTEDLVSDYQSEEEKCISFVTTRRKNDYTHDSMFVFDNSYASSSTDCDKTVLSNKNTDLECTKGFEADFIMDDTDLSRITVRKSSRVTMKDNDNELTLTEINESVICDRNETDLDQSAIVSNISNVLTRETVRRNSRVTRQDNDNELTLTEMNESVICDKNGADLDQSAIISNISNVVTREKSNSVRNSTLMTSVMDSSRFDDAKPSIVLKPGKKWERSYSIYKRMTMMTDCFEKSILDENVQNKGRKYRQSVISTMEMQDSLQNESLNSRRSTFVSKPSRPPVRFAIDPNNSRVSLNSTVYDDLNLLKGFLHEECDDTVIELSKLSIVDPEHEVTVLETFHDTDRTTTAKDYVLRRCNQTAPILFDECYPEHLLKNCHKIGEGVYGEVFLWRGGGRDARARVMKVVPVGGEQRVNGELQKAFHEIIAEIVIAMELSALRAPIAEIDRLLGEGKDIDTLDLHAVDNATDVFNEVLGVRCVYGPYPSRLLDLWELYDECKGSENDNPAALPLDQHYIVLELANAGQDLESYQFNNAQQAYALFQQIAFGLAVAEEAFQFEHRDLHWGNVLIAQTEQEYATFVLRNRVYRVPRGGVAATVIDYSLSRLSAATGGALYNDLAADEQLFDAVGDYQFEVYRLMRDKLGNEWKNFEPYTNILWLHYTVDKMITALRYKRTNTKVHKQYIDKLKAIKEAILDYGSATLFVLTHNL